MKKQIKGSLCLLLGTTIWGFAFIAQSVGMDKIGPFTFQAVRCTLAVLFLIPCSFLMEMKACDARQSAEKWKNPVLWKVGLICGCALFVATSLQQVGLVYTDAGKAGFLTAMYIVLIALGAVLVFVGQAFIQTLMLMFLADTVEYGQWKLGKRNESITFSIQPLINKIGGALSTGVVSLTLIVSGIKVDGGTVETIDTAGKLMVKAAMFALPLIFVVAGYVIYLKKYKISETYYQRILRDLEARERAE